MRVDLILPLILAVQDAGAPEDDLDAIITAAAALVAAVVSYFFGRKSGEKKGERNARGSRPYGDRR